MPGSTPPVYIFFAWVIFLAFVITIIVGYRWRHPERYSRFQLKLTLALILFLLIPTVPLLYASGSAVDVVRAFFVRLPVDEAMESGLDVVRLALTDEEQRLQAWCNEITGEGAESTSGLIPPDFNLQFSRDEMGNWVISEFRAEAGRSGFETDTLAADPPDPRIEQPQVLADVEFTWDERTFFNYRDRGVYMALIKPSESDAIECAGIWVDPLIVRARYALEEGLDKFGFITGLGGTGLQEGLWIIASLWLVILTVGAFFAARLLARGVSNPVLGLAKGMAAVADGDLNVRVDVEARDEMQVLVDSFNTMTDQLKEARERIVFVEKQAAWRDVARGIAHEIKNPLTPIQIGLHRVRTRLESDGTWETDPAIRESIQTMNEEVDALRRMAASFSEFAQLPQPDLELADLETVVRNAVALFQEGSQISRLNVRVIGQIPALKMDADLIKRAMINLVKNGVESVESAGGGEVNVVLERKGNSVQVEVRDSGIGFDPEDAARLFYPDYSTKSRGTGLGLSMVARIMADHSWQITAESNGHKTGAVMRIRIDLDREELTTPLEGLR